MYVCMYVCIQGDLCVCMYVIKCVCIYVCMYACIYVGIDLHVCIYVCIYVRIQGDLCVYIYVCDIPSLFTYTYVPCLHLIYVKQRTCSLFTSKMQCDLEYMYNSLFIF